MVSEKRVPYDEQQKKRKGKEKKKEAVASK